MTDTTAEDAPARDDLSRWHPMPADDVQAGMVVRDPAVGVMLWRPDGNSRLVRVEVRHDDSEGTLTGERWVLFTYVDIEDTWYRNVAIYGPEIPLEVWR